MTNHIMSIKTVPIWVTVPYWRMKNNHRGERCWSCNVSRGDSSGGFLHPYLWNKFQVGFLCRCGATYVEQPYTKPMFYRPRSQKDDYWRMVNWTGYNPRTGGFVQFVDSRKGLQYEGWEEEKLLRADNLRGSR